MTNIIDALNWRYATKQFDTTKKISDTDFEEILEVLRLTPSSTGLEPWNFVVVENTELREKLKAAAWNQSQITDASHLIVLCRETNFGLDEVNEMLERTSKIRNIPLENLGGLQGMATNFINGLSSEERDVWTAKQSYIALGNLLTFLASKGIDACPMEGFSKADFDEILGLKDLGLASVVVCAIGYRSSEDKYAGLPKVRKSKEEIIIRK